MHLAFLSFGGTLVRATRLDTRGSAWASSRMSSLPKSVTIGFAATPSHPSAFSLEAFPSFKPLCFRYLYGWWKLLCRPVNCFWLLLHHCLGSREHYLAPVALV